MTRSIHKLTNLVVQSKKLQPRRYGDGGGLYLSVAQGGSKSWVFIWTVKGRRREMGLGAYPAVSLASARQKAADYRIAVAEGRDPIAERKQEADPTYRECAEKYHDTMRRSWTSDAHAQNWLGAMRRHSTAILDMQVSQIKTEDVLAVLTPIWQSAPSSGRLVRGQIENVLDYAKSRGWREGENPASWRGHLKHLLPPPRALPKGHYQAMPYAEIPAFVERCRSDGSDTARLIEFLILTAVRRGEARQAQWSEFDLDNGLWVIPWSRMKARVEHIVPLSTQAVDLVGDLHSTRINDFVFPIDRKTGPVSASSVAYTRKCLGAGGVTTHGFRSSFRDWCGEEMDFPRELAELALAHSFGSAVERAYRRKTSVERRRTVMQAWADYIDNRTAQTVVEFRPLAS